MQEIWKEIEGTNGVYEVSNLGRVKSKKYRNSSREAILKTQVLSIGYPAVKMTIHGVRQTRLVHRLLAEAFLPKPTHNGKLEVNHIDGDKTNNRIDNLEWVTSSRNTDHAIECGLYKPWGKARRPVYADNLETGERIYFKSVSEAEKTLNTKHVHNVLRGDRNSAAGHSFRYVT